MLSPDAVKVKSSDECQAAIALYKGALASSASWAVQIYDSSSKLPDGLLVAGGPRLGNFEQCLAAGDSAPFPTRYCLVWYESDGPGQVASPLNLMLSGIQHQAMQLDTKVAVDVAVCAPAACDAAGAVEVATHHLAPLIAELGGTLKPSSCHYDNPIGAEAISFFVVAGILTLLVIAASFTKKLPWWSARRNLQALLATAPASSVHCVHGVRCLSMLWVVFGHKFFNMSLLAPPPTTMISESLPWPSAFLLNAYLSVDSFLLLSALLVSRAAKRAGRLDVLKFYVLRFVRLAPVLAAVVFFAACAMPVLARGPLWNQVVVAEAEYCRQRWWSALIFLNNYIDTANSCFSSSWYLSVDMQLAWLSPLVLIPLLRWRKIGIAFALLLIIATIAGLFTLTMVYDFPWTLSIISDLDKITIFWRLIYTNALLRSQPYLVGLLLGLWLEEPVKRMSKSLVLAVWCVSIGLMGFILFGLLLSHGALRDVTVAAAIYGSLHRLTWSLSLSWIIFACHRGYGGFINKILSAGVWMPLSRLTYCIFLTHLFLLMMEVGAERTEGKFSVYQVFHEYFGDLVVVLLPATALHLTVEAPVSVLVKTYLAWRRTTSASTTAICINV